MIRIFRSVFIPHPQPGSSTLHCIFSLVKSGRILEFHLDALNSCPGFIPCPFTSCLFCLNLMSTPCRYSSVTAFPETHFLASLKRVADLLLGFALDSRDCSSLSSRLLLEGLQGGLRPSSCRAQGHATCSVRTEVTDPTVPLPSLMQVCSDFLTSLFYSVKRNCQGTWVA